MVDAVAMIEGPRSSARKAGKSMTSRKDVKKGYQSQLPEPCRNERQQEQKRMTSNPRERVLVGGAHGSNTIATAALCRRSNITVHIGGYGIRVC
jgi:hypothetical protein